MTTLTPPNHRTFGSPNLWILGAKPDLLLIVLAPLLIMPLFWAAERRFTITDIAVFVAAFGAVGHHLPGMLRAYGDRNLFARFKTRFIVAPILLIIGCVAGVYYNLVILTLVALVWGFWHAVMQVYGFARIYDAKVHSTAATTARLDLLTLGCWFMLGLMSSGGHMAGALSKLHFTGGPLIEAEVLQAAWNVLLGITCIMTLFFVLNAVRQWRAGDPASPVKITLIISSISVYWYAMVYTPSTLIGIALFEVFHDIQYLAIVWGFSNRIAENNPNVGVFSHFLFRRTWPLVALYVLLVAGYGSLGLFVPKLIESGVFHKSVNGVVIASALLHFYFDGFIWKVRETSTRAGLNLAGGEIGAKNVIPRVPRWSTHTLKWGLLLVPVLYFGFAQRLHPPNIDRYRVAAEAYPYAEPHYKVGRRFLDLDRPNEARHHFEEALRLDPDFAPAHHEVGMLLMRQRPVEGVKHLARVVELEPDLKKPRLIYADALRILGRLPEAIEQYRHAVRLGAKGAQRKLDESLAELQSLEAAEHEH